MTPPTETAFYPYQGDGLPREKGSWASTSEGVWLCCPNCGLTAQLDHEISDKGEVSPSVDCPNCEYHESGVRLLGWK